MPAPASVLRELIADALPGIARRAGRDRLDELAEAAARAPGETPVRQLAACLVQIGQERDGVLRRLEADAQVLRAAVAAGNARHALLDALPRLSPRSKLRQDRRALRRWLDASAVEDRMVLRRHAVDQAWEMMALAVAAQPLGDVAPAVRDELRRAALAVIAEAGTRWTVRVAAVRLCGALGEAALGDKGVGEVRDVVRRLARDAAEDPWVQVAAIEVWTRWCSRDESVALLRFVLRRPAGETGPVHRDAVFTRGRAARMAADHGGWDLLGEVLADRTESEHVRMEAARGLARSPRRDDLDRVAALLASEPDGWRVAAAGAVALVDREDDAGLDALAEPLVAAHPRAVHVVLDAVQARVRDGRLDAARGVRLALIWRAALARWAAAEEQPDTARLAAVLATWARLQADPRTREAHAEVARFVAAAREGDRRRFPRGPVAGLTAGELLDVLFTVAHEDLDLCAGPLGHTPIRGPDDRSPRGWWIRVGLERRRAAWRVLHELRHPRNDKRQAWSHVVDDVPAGPLVAWSGRMAEVVATGVPGRRSATPTTLSWGEHLPLPANLLGAARHGAVLLRAPRSRVLLTPRGPAARLGAHRRYVALADLRERLAELPPADAVRAYDHALAEAGFSSRREPVALGAAVPWLGMDLDWLARAGSSDAGTFGQLAVISSAALGFFVGRHLVREARVRSWRRRVPFVVGGWGSRGKSSVERLKAALFHGLGYTVLCKSTGCEAMLLLGYPGADPVEVFLYRPRDKATIVEQQRVLQVAARLRPQVLLYECMALNPLYVTILQRDWMRDDFTTLTNTYPDHEDVQGPSGRDVADVISLFTPFGGQVFSSEHHMTPVLERRARERGSTFHGARPEHWDLIPRDLLARFPDQAYDRNVALVCRLAAGLDVPFDVAIRTMADHVLIDLGAFKKYGPVDVEGRRLAYLAGNSANDRASFLSNWERSGVGEFDDTSGLSSFLVVVVNNRGDRLARQAMFSRIVALDVAADRVVLIGTNVLPMHDQIQAAFAEVLVPRLREIGHGPDGRRKLLDLMITRLRRRPMGLAAQEAALAAAGAVWARAAGAGGRSEAADAAIATWREEVAWLDGLRDDYDVDAAIERFVAFLARRVVPFADPSVSGDRILHDVAAMFPPGASADLLGCANIKGTGLDLVYRWVGIERVLGWLADLASDNAAVVRDRLERLATYDDWGLYDALHAARVLAEMRGRGDFARVSAEDDAEAALAAVERAVRERRAKLEHAGPRKTGWWERFRRATRDLDLLGSYRRRAAADRLLDDLAETRVGLVRAAREAKRLVDGEKK